MLKGNMDITYLGHSSFKIKAKTASVVTDPYDSKMVGLKFTPTDAEIVTVSHEHPDHNTVDKISGIKKIVRGPGEYEISGISVIGLSTYHDSKKGEERGKNTIYLIEADGMKIVHLGDLGHTLNDSLLEEIGDVDILMIPVGGYYTIGPKEAVEIIGKIEPNYVLPMHYSIDGMNEDLSQNLLPVEDFLKESGLTTENMSRFTLKKEEVNNEQSTKVVVLEKK